MDQVQNVTANFTRLSDEVIPQIFLPLVIK
jgi:hypothetical protein